MRITQGCFSFLPDLTDEQISKQVQYCLDNGWAVSLSIPKTRIRGTPIGKCGGHPMFDIRDAKAVMGELQQCRLMHGECYIRLCAFDSTHTWESLRISFIVQRPGNEPGFMLTRQEAGGRNIRYETRAFCCRETGRCALLMPDSATPDTLIDLRAEFAGAGLEPYLNSLIRIWSG